MEAAEPGTIAPDRQATIVRIPAGTEVPVRFDIRVPFGMLVVDGDQCLLGQSAGRLARTGMYSALAGFIDQGESIEEALANLQEATELYLEEFEVTSYGTPLMTTFEVAARAPGSMSATI